MDQDILDLLVSTQLNCPETHRHILEPTIRDTTPDQTQTYEDIEDAIMMSLSAPSALPLGFSGTDLRNDQDIEKALLEASQHFAIQRQETEVVLYTAIAGPPVQVEYYRPPPPNPELVHFLLHPKEFPQRKLDYTLKKQDIGNNQKAKEPFIEMLQAHNLYRPGLVARVFTGARKQKLIETGNDREDGNGTCDYNLFSKEKRRKLRTGEYIWAGPLDNNLVFSAVGNTCVSIYDSTLMEHPVYRSEKCQENQKQIYVYAFRDTDMHKALVALFDVKDR